MKAIKIVVKDELKIFTIFYNTARGQFVIRSDTETHLIYRDNYNYDGKIKTINELNDNGRVIKRTFYRPDGTIKKIIEYNSDGTKKIK
ncbi:DUF2963 domain-containing protein [Candidatus Phytoplasma sp. AldY-WA1]|uniref:DUF2963 domain-containing protein n=1 Tax=Candidatus Phytoplasma sp. AldY-WA1 TaxID=2852100 RepID=UPI00254A855B|nr:DUF2963 domain-containing protein [Candidatus Phytoplasma sp. AldY-WA1]